MTVADCAEVFRWIVGVFRKHDVSFVVSGGLAANAYGSPRAVRDLDFDIEETGFPRILRDVEPWITQSPHRHKSKAFENTLLKLRYKGIDIDIASATGAKIFDSERGEWVADEADLTRYQVKEVYGIEVPVMRPEDLIAYKSKAPRTEDLVDIEAIKSGLEDA